MQTKQKIIIGVSSAVVLGTVIFILINRSNKEKAAKLINDILDAKVTDPNASNSGQVVINKTAYDALPAGNFPLKVGDKNKKVYAVQMALNKTFGSSIDLDGKYGESTFVTMCSKIWNTGVFTSKYTDCYDTGLSGVTRKSITQADYDKIILHKN